MDTDHVIYQLARRLGHRLRKAQLLLATAESCTGGLLASAITAVAGSSHWFERGFVTYSNQSKIEMLDVSAELIDQFGAVSEPVANAMAAGALHHSRAQVTLAITGIAGPGPSDGHENKPVGTVCFAWRKEGQSRCKTLQFKGDRQQIRLQAVRHALSILSHDF